MHHLDIIEFWRKTILVNAQLQRNPHSIRIVFREDYLRVLTYN